MTSNQQITAQIAAENNQFELALDKLLDDMDTADFQDRTTNSNNNNNNNSNDNNRNSNSNNNSSNNNNSNNNNSNNNNSHIKWRDIAKRAINKLVEAQGSLTRASNHLRLLEHNLTQAESDARRWRQQHNRAAALSSRLSQHLRTAADESFEPPPPPCTTCHRHRVVGTSSPSQRPSREPPTPTTTSANRSPNRSPQSDNRRVHWDDDEGNDKTSAHPATHNINSDNPGRCHECERQREPTPSSSYHINFQELRRERERRAHHHPDPDPDPDQRNHFFAQKMREFNSERDRLSRRFNRSLRGASNAHFPGFQHAWTGPGMSRRPDEPSPPPPSPPPSPPSVHSFPDPFAYSESIPVRADALPPELYSYVMTGGAIPHY